MSGTHSTAVLELARSMRVAVERRTTTCQEVLDNYDEALHDRATAAAEFLRTVHKADEAYDRALAEASYTFRESFEADRAEADRAD